MPYWGSSDTAHTHGPCEHCDEILDVLRREEAENERLRAEREQQYDKGWSDCADRVVAFLDRADLQGADRDA